LGLAEALGNRGRGLERLLPLESLLDRRSVPGRQKFVSEYKRRYNALPDALAALGYDAARILADAMTRAGSTDGAKVRDALAATKDFQGVTGLITINKDRNAVKPAVILKVENGKFHLVETIKPESVKI
jgi:branched-chain amino acid transport system substrate-binding protein